MNLTRPTEGKNPFMKSLFFIISNIYGKEYLYEPFCVAPFLPLCVQNLSCDNVLIVIAKIELD